MSEEDPARARLARALGPFGAEALDALDRVSAVRFCAPDTALEALDEASVSALRGYVDELDAAARSFPLTPRGDPWDCPVVLTRSMGEAVRLWLDAWSAVASQRHPGHRWIAALRALASHPFVALRERTRGDDCRRDLAQRVSRSLGISTRTSVAWREAYAGELLAYWPGEQTALAHVAWCAAFGAAPASPWSPALALWERGVWPVVLATGGVLLYVPVRQGETLVAEPEASSEARGAWPTFEVPRALLRVAVETGLAVPPGRFSVR